MTARALTLALGLAVMAPPAAAQEPDDLGRLMQTFTVLWEREDAGALVKLSARTGLDLEVQGYAMGPLTGRRAAAALRHLFGAQRTVGVRSGGASRIAGTDDQAFAELAWDVRAAGGTVTERNIVFVGFVREGSTWKISQIRILP